MQVKKGLLNLKKIIYEQQQNINQLVEISEEDAIKYGFINDSGNQSGNNDEPENPDTPITPEDPDEPIVAPDVIEVYGIMYYKVQPNKPGENYELISYYSNEYNTTYYAWKEIEQVIPDEPEEPIINNFEQFKNKKLYITQYNNIDYGENYYTIKTHNKQNCFYVIFDDNNNLILKLEFITIQLKYEIDNKYDIIIPSGNWGHDYGTELENDISYNVGNWHSYLIENDNLTILGPYNKNVIIKFSLTRNEPIIIPNEPNWETIPDCYLNNSNYLEYFTIESLEESINISFNKQDLWWSKDKNNWYYLDNSIILNNNQNLYIKGNLTLNQQGEIGNFSINGKCNISGNIMSLIFNDDFIGKNDLTGYSFKNLFINCKDIINTENLILPAKTLTQSCYQNMFKGCTSLITAPELPATILIDNCYSYMFNNCRSLSSAPSLPATTLANSCYDHMFSVCRSLTIAPSLPSTTLADSCYLSMFSGCWSLTIAPSLPATTLANNCYHTMFCNCKSLTTTPDLLSITLSENCYNGMFKNCSKLVNIFNILPATILTKKCYCEMFRNCTLLTNAPKLIATTLAENCYSGMFKNCTSLVQTPELPATTLYKSIMDFKEEFNGIDDNLSYHEYFIRYIENQLNPFDESEYDSDELLCFNYIGCYESMFENCTSLTSAPSLPATNLTEHCYYKMFSGCTSLVQVPELPATTLDCGCYRNMFSGCISLVQTPELPATILTPGCYHKMFNNCTSLTTAPELPATTLAPGCYYSMFSNCTSLVQAPELLSIILYDCCYYSMFNNCTSLNYIKCLANQSSINKYTSNWTNNVTQNGTFIKNSNMIYWSLGLNGIPEGWKIIEVDE